MSDIGKGDWVLCVRSLDDGRFGAVVAGLSYFVEDVGDAEFLPDQVPFGSILRGWICSRCGAHDKPVLRLTGLQERRHWCPCLFRSMKKPPGEERRVCQEVTENA